MKLIALIPAYRPDVNLLQLVQSLLDRDFFAIVIVNDGRESEYNVVFETLSNISGVTVLNHVVNLGKGAALKTGINHICGIWEDDAGIITVDADGQHKVEDVIKVAQELNQNRQNLILGCRNFTGNVPFKSWFGNTSTRFLLKLAHGLSLTDTQTGLRGMSAELARKFLTIRANRYNFELDMLLDVKKLGVTIREIPIETIYLDDNKSSHFNPIFDSAKIYFSLFRFSGAGFITAIIDNLVFIILFFLGLPLFASQATGRTIASTVNYVMVKNLVFHSQERNSIALPKYIATVIVLGLLSYSLILFSVAYLPLPVILAKIFAEALIFLSSFLIQRTFIFKEAKE